MLTNGLPSSSSASRMWERIQDSRKDSSGLRQVSGQMWMVAKSIESGMWFNLKFWPMSLAHPVGFCQSLGPGAQKPSSPTVTR